MPSLELAAGQVVTAAHTNTYWMRQVIATGLSSARPTPYEGRAAYDTDTDALVIYTTATTGWRAPWNLPWGLIDSAEISSDTSQSNTDVALCSMNVPVLKGRRYRVSGMARVGQPTGVSPNVGTAHWYPGFSTGAANLVAYRSTLLMGQGADLGGPSTDHVLPFANIYDAVSTGNVLIQGRAWSASFVVKWYAGCWIDIEDVGPASAPA